MRSSIKLLLLFLVIISFIAFLGGIITAGYYSYWIEGAPLTAKMPSFLVNLVITVGGVLATNFGAVIGLSSSQSSTFNEVSFFQPMGGGASSSESTKPKRSELIQVIGAWGYVLGLLLALVLWLFSNFSEDPEVVVALLGELSKTFIGVIVGALAVALGIEE